MSVFKASLAAVSPAPVDPDFDHWSVRRSGGASYNTNTEIVVANLPSGTLAHSTIEGLGPSATMGFKVYVVLTTANEKGSNTVTITNA